MDMVLKYYYNKISYLTKCTNTRPKKIAKKGKIPDESIGILLQNRYTFIVSRAD